MSGGGNYKWIKITILAIIYNLTVGAVLTDIVIAEGGLRFNYQAGQIGHSVAKDSVMFLRSCVAQALSRGDGSRHSLHASA